MKKEEYVYQVFQSVAEGYDAANRRISLGLHMRWKRAAAKLLLRSTPPDGRVLDLCCGTGDMTALLLSLAPGLRVTGADFSPNMLAVARRRFEGESRAAFTTADAAALPYEDAAFDGAAISFALRNTADYPRVLGELARVVKSGASVCVIDSFRPRSRFVRFFYDIYFSCVMPILGGGRAKREEYRWLCRSTREFISPDGLEKLMAGQGLSAAVKKSFMFGSCACVCAHREERE